MVLRGCRSNKHLHIPNLMLDTVNVQLVKKHSCDANFCPFCQEWEKLDIWRSKNDFSLLLILFQNWYLTSGKALSEANLSSCRVLPPVTTVLNCDYCVAVIAVPIYSDLYLFSTVSFPHLTLILDLWGISALRERRRQWGMVLLCCLGCFEAALYTEKKLIFNGRTEDLLDGYLNISTNFSLPGKSRHQFYIGVLPAALFPWGMGPSPRRTWINDENFVELMSCCLEIPRKFWFIPNQPCVLCVPAVWQGCSCMDKAARICPSSSYNSQINVALIHKWGWIWRAGINSAHSILCQSCDMLIGNNIRSWKNRSQFIAQCLLWQILHWVMACLFQTSV